ncbi:amidohydrolase family protein [Streptomyces sp. NPDC056112]|uniref:amidohydrolase family protein n=1 Tax=Streptomyces sp. NPDC056112 TaxID=3345715 RepID=UPI0035DC21F7
MNSVVVKNARFANQPGQHDIEIEAGRIHRITPAGEGGSATDELDAQGGLVTPSFVDAHFHPDKALTFPRVGPMGQGSPVDSLAVGARIKAAFTVDDVTDRARRAMEAAVTSGVGAIRAQVDVDSAIGLAGLQGILKVKAELHDVVDLQIVAFPQEGVVRDPGALDLLREALTMGADVLGGGPDNEGDPAFHRAHLDQLFELAAEFDVDLDLHADMDEDPSRRALELIAERTLAHGWQGRVNAVHCCALAAYPDDLAHRVIEQVAQAGIQICICPIGNLQLVGGDVTPRGRGSSRPKELLAAGVNVAAGTDNLHDMWFRFGNLDPVETSRITCLAAGLRTDQEVLEGFAMVTDRAAAYLGLGGYGIAPGNDADLVMFSADNLSDVMRGVPGTRTTLKRGRVVAHRETTARMVRS